MIERRVHKRELVDAPVRLYHPVIGSLSGQIRDVSKGGMFIELNEVPKLHVGECEGRLHCKLMNIDVLFFMECVRVTDEGIVLVHVEEQTEVTSLSSDMQPAF
jgi:hypothetical protein